MKLESLKLEKFKNNSIKKEQMFMLNGGGTKTGGGSNLYHESGGYAFVVDYAYDVMRDNVSGGLTLHGYSNRR
ncbi:MAG: hypothetical protein HKN90_05380 [Flavobacteriaceae bacterium]|nr:hypothetical protein [Flavobacteriaceae bacterium]